MRKFIFILLTFLMMVPTAYGANTLWEYFQGDMPSMAERAKLSYEAGLTGISFDGSEYEYQGTYGQNVALLAYLQGSFPAENMNIGAIIPTVIGFFETSLASKISSSAASMTLVDGTDDDGTTLSGTFGFIIDEGSASEEVVVATCAGTACTGMRRGVSVLDGWTEVSANKLSHRRGASVKLTNFPQLAIISRIMNGDERFPNLIGYESNLTIASTTDFASKVYVDNSVAQGAPTSTEITAGISELATLAEQADGTAFDANNPHVINSENATSTPSGGASAATRVVVSESDGKLNQLWYDLAEDFTFSSTTISGLYVTTSATSTRAVVGTGNPTTNAPLFVTGDAYQIGNATTTGSLAVNKLCIDNKCFDDASHSKLLYASTTGPNVQTNTSEETTYSISIPGGSLSTDNVINGRFYIDNIIVDDIGTDGVVTIKIKYGGTTMNTITLTNSSTGSLQAPGFLEFSLMANESASAQALFSDFMTFTEGVVAAGSVVSITDHSVGSATEDSTGTLNLVITTQTSASGDNRLYWDGGYVELID